MMAAEVKCLVNTVMFLYVVPVALMAASDLVWWGRK